MSDLRNPENRPSTGYGGFDAEIDRLFALDLEDMQKRIAAGEDPASLIAAFGSSAFRVARALEESEWIEMLSRAHPKQLAPYLNELREFTRRLLGPILNDPKRSEALDAALSSRTAGSTADGEAPENYNVISKMAFYSDWGFHRGTVIPRLRTVLKDWNDRQLLDTTMDWDDLIYVAYRLIDALREDFDNLRLVSSEARANFNMKEEYGDRSAKRLSLMMKDLQVLREKMMEIGFSKDDFGF